MKNINEMTIATLKNELDDLKVSYPSKAKKADLYALYAAEINRIAAEQAAGVKQAPPTGAAEGGLAIDTEDIDSEEDGVFVLDTKEGVFELVSGSSSKAADKAESKPQAQKAAGLTAPIGQIVDPKKWAQVAKQAQEQRDREALEEKARQKKIAEQAAKRQSKAAGKATHKAAGKPQIKIVVNDSIDPAKIDVDRYAAGIRNMINRAVDLNMRFLVDQTDRKCVVRALIGTIAADTEKAAIKAAEEAAVKLKAAAIDLESGKISAEKYDKIAATAANKAKVRDDIIHFCRENAVLVKQAEKDLALIYGRGGSQLFCLVRQYVEGSFEFSATAAKIYEAARENSRRAAIDASSRSAKAEKAKAKQELLTAIEKYFVGLTYKAPAKDPLFRNFSWNMKAAEKEYIATYVSHRVIGKRQGLFCMRDVTKGGVTRSMVLFALMRLQGVKIVAATMDGLKELDF